MVVCIAQRQTSGMLLLLVIVHLVIVHNSLCFAMTFNLASLAGQSRALFFHADTVLVLLSSSVQAPGTQGGSA
jgi:hypothetical protein